MLEDQSRDTWENAVFTKALVKPKPGQRWLLVTSAWHMPRAMGVFRKAGFPVEPWPVDYRTAGRRTPGACSARRPTGCGGWRSPSTNGSGLLAYWLRGRSAELFPGPQN